MVTAVLLTPEEFETFLTSAHENGVLACAVRPPGARNAMCYLGHMYYVKTGKLPDIGQGIQKTKEGIYGGPDNVPALGTTYGFSDRYVMESEGSYDQRGHPHLDSRYIESWAKYLIDRGVIAIIEGDES